MAIRGSKKKAALLLLAYHELKESRRMARYGLKRMAMREKRNAMELFRLAGRC